MKLANLVGDRFKERPAGAVIDSHALMLRGGYMKFVASGIFSQFPPLLRTTKKIEAIIREEMNKIDGQEVLFPVAMPASLWEESGRYSTIASELLRFKDRNNVPMVLGMTHEEAAVQLVREFGTSYSKYPFMIYQIQTKFRDEARPRAGMIRVREFTMKDAYSFHTSMEDLEQYYDRCHRAYERVFARAGVPEVVSVKSDSGMMGGSVSHEFMLLTPIGEDTLVICPECGYSANMEAADCIIPAYADEELAPLTLTHTPNAQTIEEVATFLSTDVKKTAKAVVYQENLTDDYVVVFTRGDLDVNETKLRNFLGKEIHPAVITEESGIVAGFIGAVDFAGKATLLFDKSLEGAKNLVCGANKVDYHYTGFNVERDYCKVEYHDFSKAFAGGICPCCAKESLTISNGIEVGNIFQLGTKYTKTMGMSYLDENGESQCPIMGCYGIGVGRLAASVCEAYHDDFGPIWPISIAPWQVHLCCVRADDAECKAVADKLYKDMQESGIEVIYDDRDVRAGVMFSDADLLGTPLRVVISPRNLGDGVVEITSRDKSINMKVPTADAFETVKKTIADMFAAIDAKVPELK